MWIYDYIIEPIVLTVFLNHVFPQMSLIARLFAQDGVANSTRYLLGHLSVPVKQPQVSPYTKYTIFIGLAGINYLGDVVTWFQYPQLFLYYICLLASCPIILEDFLKSQIWLSEQLAQFQKKTLNYSACLCLSKSLNYICVQNLNCNPKISASELDEVLGFQNLNYIWTFLKIILVTTIIKYLEKSKYIYGKLLKYLYDSGNLITIPQRHQSMILDCQTKDPKKTLSKIVMRRKWHYFYDPTVLNMIVKIYREQDGNLIQEVLTDFKNRTLQFGSLWTLSSFIPLPFLAFLFRVRDPYPYNLIIPAIDLLLLLAFPTQIVWIALFSAYSNYLNNSLTKHFYAKAKDEAPKALSNLVHHNKYNLYLALSVPVTYYLAGINRYTLLVLPLIARFNFIYIWSVFFGWFSDYDLVHLTVLAFVLYFLVNIFNLHKCGLTCSGSNSSGNQDVKIDIIKSYWPQQQHIENRYYSEPNIMLEKRAERDFIHEKEHLKLS